MDTSNIRSSLLVSDETFATTLLVILIDRFGSRFMNGEDGVWTPETLRMEINNAFGVDIPDYNLGKLVAAISVLTTDNFYRSLPSFLCTVHGLLGDGLDWAYAEPIELDDLAWAMLECILLSPPEDEDMFDPQIVEYCRYCLKQEGLLSPPSVMAFAKEDDAYGLVSPFDEDVMIEQADRTNAVNDYLDVQVEKMVAQLASIPGLNKTAEGIMTALMLDLEAATASEFE